MDFLLSLSPAAKLGLTLLAIVGLMRAKAPMGAALLVGAGLLGLLFPTGWGPFLKAVFLGLTSEQTLFLAVIVTGLLAFSGVLNATGQIQRIIAAFTALVGRSRLTLVTFPALIGLLPMPGGAIFSAPMVREAARDTHLSAARLAVANYWFRHIWEFWFPLYPGVILVLTLTGMPTGRFILAQAPMTLFALVAGYVVILRTAHMSGEKKRDYSWLTIRRFLVELIPILLVVGAVIALSPAAEILTERLTGPRAPDQGPAPGNILLQRSPILAGLILGMAWLFLYRGLTWRIVRQAMFKKSIMQMLFLVVGLLVFESVLQNSGAVIDLRKQFETSGVPLEVVISLLPFICGLVVGIAFGFVGASFPLVIALLSHLPPGERLPYYCLAYVMGYIGMMVSPVHICLIVTNEYFQSRLGRVYAYLLPLGVACLLFGILLFLVNRAIW
ncbi:DUF401 family protein [bacterium]|nr:DUF401 family protein [bacterium]